MNLRDRIEGVLGDFLNDTEERMGILNNIMFYTQKVTKQKMLFSFIVGVVFTLILLKWLS